MILKSLNGNFKEGEFYLLDNITGKKGVEGFVGRVEKVVGKSALIQIVRNLTSQTNRRFKRVYLTNETVPVLIERENRDYLIGVLKDISLGGCGIELYKFHENVNKGEFVRLKLKYDDESFVLDGIVAHHNKEKNTLGIIFSGHDENKRVLDLYSKILKNNPTAV